MPSVGPLVGAHSQSDDVIFQRKRPERRCTAAQRRASTHKLAPLPSLGSSADGESR